MIVCASYNGQPPDNAVKFCAWLAPGEPTASEAVLHGLRLRQQRLGRDVPGGPDPARRRLEPHGAHRAYPRGEGDARGDFDAAYRPGTHPVADIADALGTDAPHAQTAPRPAARDHRDQPAGDQPGDHVLPGAPAPGAGNRELIRGANAARSTRHLEIALPAGLAYQAGDHLGVLPRNNIDLIRRVMARFGLDAGSTSRSSRTAAPHPPADRRARPAARDPGRLRRAAGRRRAARHRGDGSLHRAIRRSARSSRASSAPTRSLRPGTASEVLARGRSLLDLLEDYPACDMPFEVFLDLLPPLRPRYYSISSSPAVSADIAASPRGVARTGALRGRRLHWSVLELPASSCRRAARCSPSSGSRRSPSGRRRIRRSR